jgi:glutamine synthetase
MLFHLEFVWLDGSTPQKLRSKTKIIKSEHKTISPLYQEYKADITKIKKWNFDGSSTYQATTNKSELILNPVNVYMDPFKPEKGLLILCEVEYPNGDFHESNTRCKLREVMKTAGLELDNIFTGLEQEYFIYDSNTNKPLGWPMDEYNPIDGHVKTLPREQGDFYCGVGGNNVMGREFAYEHSYLCEYAGLDIDGINIEVALGQLEYQVSGYGIECCDQLWMSRYILERLTERYNWYINYHPKPFIGNEINGSGMHLNFSTREMRDDIFNKKQLVIEACDKIGENIEAHIHVYGIDNHLRLTGANETSSITEFKYGVGDRTASIRIPSSITDNTTPGYLEDRRPASNADPYQMVEVMIKTVCISVEA